MPDTFGVSLVFEAEVVHVMEDGSEILVHLMEDDDFENAVREFPSVRFRSIKSADFVDAPASNRNGLFSAITKDINMEKELQEEIVEEVQLEEAPVEETENQVEETNFEEIIKGLEDRISELEGKLSEEQKINETLSELIEGEDPIDEDEGEVEEINLMEKFSKASGVEATELFRSNRAEIRKLFNQSRKG